MQSYTQTFLGAQTWKINVTGSYFTIISCTNPVNVRFYLGGAKLDLGDVQGILAGLEVLPKKLNLLGYAFDRVEIDATGADTITVGIGNGDARYNRGNASVTLTAATRMEDPFSVRYTSSYKSSTALAITTPETVFLAGANANGAIVYRASFLSLYSGGYFPACFVSKATPPANAKDGDVILSADGYSFNSAGPYSIQTGKLEKPLLIPAGQGLYFISDTAEGSAMRSALYRFL